MLQFVEMNELASAQLKVTCWQGKLATKLHLVVNNSKLMNSFQHQQRLDALWQMQHKQYGCVDECRVDVRWGGGAHLGLNIPTIASETIFEVLRSKAGASQIAFKADEAGFWSLVIPVSLITHAAGVWRPFRGRGHAAHVWAENHSLSPSAPCSSINFNGQSFNGHKKWVGCFLLLLIRWFVNALLLVGLTNMQLFISQVAF